MRTDDCPLSIALKPLRGKWEPLIIKYLSMNGSSGYNEIYNSIENITPKALTEALRILSEDGIINKNFVSMKPLRVIYTLTEKGKAMMAPLDAIESLNGKQKKLNS
ncbi:MAG: transcriptional regulator, HxlR family [Ferroplasma sp. Type II]|jgi:DNA-binding HxlR family transcriptional regulator|uniref:winged helix-turn-helix transcriptional regulator n=1 Tax=Ferroplasma sp. Type II TaxID=261388 RepID=UPI0003894D75|nr:helix-turn-helix domain-containing protein [Ferroplasma sp. Type II]EQB73571.1 MAG: transcriptional regulator, HxlR family [Ferroplasma sp. Type II]HIH59670.1 helix-turn-helix transcriptional regulator [Ferroplasma sp.]HII82602.1 helix-turn-helix transcriptional regulator [Ferroplasma sp.]